MTRVYVVRSGIRLEPFGDLARDLPVGGVALAEGRNRLFAHFGLEAREVDDLSEIPPEEPRIVTFDHVYFTRRILKDFLTKWRTRGHAAVRAALPRDSAFVRGFSDLQDLDEDGERTLFDLFGLPSGAKPESRAAMVEAARPIDLVYRDVLIDVAMPKRVVGREDWKHPITSSVIVHVRHWLPLLHANLLSIQVRWVDEVIGHPLWSVWTLLRGLLPGRGRAIWRIGARANRLGRNVDVHPTARVEGSIIGEGTTIGPGALVRGSLIGKNVTIEPRADVFASVIGDRCFVSKHSIVYACVAMEEADVCMKGMQMCLVGRRAALTARATPVDLPPPGHRHRVKDGTELREVSVPLLGSCYGHECFVGADVYVGAARAIPNGVRLGPRSDRILTRLPETLEAGRTYAVFDGEAREP